ncbi:MAG: aspartate--tRNA ligase [Actinobacteria bacterium]|nr:aspartate--tRNA ligase [Actinomycetota bacterium]
MGDQPLRSDKAGELRVADEGRQVRLAGWVASRRDLGGVYFLVIRDASGRVQVVIDPQADPAAGEIAKDLRDEYCVAVTGGVRRRPEGTANPDMPTGEIEVAASQVTVLSPADPLPFQIDDRSEVDETRRLKWRYLDLRRPRMAANLVARSRGVAAMRRSLERQGFMEVETPTLIRSTPEGARDVLVPSRLRPGSFYALPQSPQLFKQLLMIGGVERYYQIARCYRDEDFRSDRQLEFTQLDIEGSFWGRDDVLEALEQVIVEVLGDLRGIHLETPFPRLTYRESMDRYGTDKPDTRFGMEIRDLGAVFAGTGFRAFAGILDSGGVVRGINAGPRGLSRSGLDALGEIAKGAGAKALAWFVVEEGGTLRSPVAKFLGEAEVAGLVETFAAVPGDTLLVVADDAGVVAPALDRLRRHVGHPDPDALRFLWVIDFPVFEKAADGSLAPAHHPFTSPHDVDEMGSDPEHALSHAYDLVLNGSELGSGSVRIHDPAVQRRVFEILGIADEEAESRFGWFLEALRYGTPPHAGFAVGIDRLVSILQGEPNIREIIPFPKTQTGADPLTQAPTGASAEQLAELGLAVVGEAAGEEAGGADPAG